MGDNIYLGDRNGVRTPMQWSPDRNAGFSRADPQRLYLPPIMDPVYGYQAVNVEAQERDPGSLLQLDQAHARDPAREPARSAAAGSRSCSPATARCSPTCASTTTKRCCASPTSRARRSRSSSTSRASRAACRWSSSGRTSFPPVGELPYLLTLPAHALLLVPPRHRRRRAGVAHADDRAGRGADAGAVRRLDLASSATRWCRGASRMAEQLRRRLEERGAAALHRGAALVCGERRAGAGGAHRGPRGLGGRRTELAAHAPRDRQGKRTSCRMALAWEEDEEQVRQLAQSSIVRVRQQANVGVVGDAMADEGFCRNVVKAIGESRSLPDRARQHPLHADRGLPRASPARPRGAHRGPAAGAVAPTPRSRSPSACSSSATASCGPA